MTQKTLYSAVLVATIALAAGCVSSKPARFYQLQQGALEPLAAASAGDTCPVINLIMVDLPDYLERAQLVTRLSDHQLAVEDYERWSESLEENTIRVVRQNLGQLIPGLRIIPDRMPASLVSCMELAIVIDRMDGRPGDEVVLTAHWGIRLKEEDTDVLFGNGTYRKKAGGGKGDYAGFVAAMSETLADVCRDIAADILKLKQP